MITFNLKPIKVDLLAIRNFKLYSTMCHKN